MTPSAPAFVAVLAAPCAPAPLRAAALAWLEALDARWGLLLDTTSVLAGVLGEAAGPVRAVVWTTFQPLYAHPDAKAAAVFGYARGAVLARARLGADRVREWERESGVAVLQAPLESEVRRQEARARAAGGDRVQ